MSSLIPPGREIETKNDRRRRWFVGGVLLAFAIMAGTLSLIAFAYIEQLDKVEALETQNEKILDDHHAIGNAFAQQTKKLARQSRKLEAVVRSSYGQGYLAGRQASQLPRALRSLARHAATGLLVPRRLPSALGSAPQRLKADVDGYAIRWGGLALFASRTDPLSVWTRQALGGVQPLTLGGHRVRRLTGPSGVIYAWRENDVTYALIALPRLEPVGRTLIGSMK
jgi:cell division protein FtsB